MNIITKYILPFPIIDNGERPIGLDEEQSKYWVYSLQNEFRLYQFTIVQTTFYYNTLVCLPTGLGKTFIAAMAILNFSKWFPTNKIFFLAPTRPLVNQQCEAMKRFGINGILSKNDRSYEQQIYFSTPQTLENDLNQQLIDSIILIVFDEAHKGVGDYSYAVIMKKLSYRTRIIGLSATPGNNIDQIQEVMANLRISKIELRDEMDPEVVPYLKFKKVEKVIVSFNNNLILDELNHKIQPLLNQILSFQILPVELIRVCSKAEVFSYGTCFKLREFLLSSNIQFQIGQENAQSIFEIMSILYKFSYGKKILLEQGIQPYANYMNIPDLEEDHPKIATLKNIFKKHFESSESKVIVFTNSRDNAQLLCNHINEVEKVKASIFVGQASSKTTAGMKQKEQLQVIEKFKTELNVLVATCIAEEGLDIGEVDLIICYDSGFSPIRMIQRMGRTGRKRDGKIIVLLTEGKETADYEKSVNKYQKLIKELKQSNLNFYSSNPRLLQEKPELVFQDGDVNNIELTITKFEEGQSKTKNIMKKKLKDKETKQAIKINDYFQKVKVLSAQKKEQSVCQQVLIVKEPSPIQKKDFKIQKTPLRIDAFIKNKCEQNQKKPLLLKVNLKNKMTQKKDQINIELKDQSLIKNQSDNEETLNIYCQQNNIIEENIKCINQINNIYEEDIDFEQFDFSSQIPENQQTNKKQSYFTIDEIIESPSFETLFQSSQK